MPRSSDLAHVYFMTSQTIVQAVVATTTLPRITSGTTHLRSRGANVGNGNNDVLGATKPSANVENNRSIIIARLPLHNVILAGRPSELCEVVHRYLQASTAKHAAAQSMTVQGCGSGGWSFLGPVAVLDEPKHQFRDFRRRYSRRFARRHPFMKFVHQ